MRKITSVGKGNGPVIALFDGFYRHWKGFLKGRDPLLFIHRGWSYESDILFTGADRVGMDVHLYQAFNSKRPDINVASQIQKVRIMKGKAFCLGSISEVAESAFFSFVTVLHKDGVKSQHHVQEHGYHICRRMVAGHEWYLSFAASRFVPGWRG
jgi:hypothetical protein